MKINKKQESQIEMHLNRCVITATLITKLSPSIFIPTAVLCRCVYMSFGKCKISLKQKQQLKCAYETENGYAGYSKAAENKYIFDVYL